MKASQPLAVTLYAITTSQADTRSPAFTNVPRKPSYHGPLKTNAIFPDEDEDDKNCPNLHQ